MGDASENEGKRSSGDKMQNQLDVQDALEEATPINHEPIGPGWGVRRSNTNKSWKICAQSFSRRVSQRKWTGRRAVVSFHRLKESREMWAYEQTYI